jgi:hypothetical protein
VKSRKFVRVEQQNARSTTTLWIIDLSTVVRMCPDACFVVFDDGGSMCLTKESAANLVKELEAIA